MRAGEMVASLSPAPRPVLAGPSLPSSSGCRPVLFPVPHGRASVCPCSASLLLKSPRFSKENDLQFLPSPFPPWIRPAEMQKLLKSGAGGLFARGQK